MMDFAFKFSLAFFLALVLAVPSTRADATPEAKATIVLFNTNDPDSKSLAQYYATKREIPPSQVVGLNCSSAEEISRADYDATIAGPLREIFKKRGWWKMGAGRVVMATTIRFVAIMRGVPLKISPDATIPPATFVQGLPELVAARNDAAVDSELAALGIPVPSVAGLLPNPYFRRFTPILENPIDPGILLPARLDGPTVIMVRAMIDDALTAERSGLWGWAYVDARNITSGGYAEGDAWMNNLVAAMRPAGIPVIFDNLPATIPAGFPVTDAAIYYGWYNDTVNGPFAEPGFQFQRGAVAVHIHSFSAASLRNAEAFWCGPLVAHGVAATMGNVYEPYLSLTANLDIFQDRLMAGMTFAESAYISQRALSWMGTVIGDPLYRPYRAWFSPATDNLNPWQTYRGIVTGVSGGPIPAARDLKRAAAQSGNSMFLEALGVAQLDAGQSGDAVQSLDAASKIASPPLVARRIDLERIAALQALGRADEASIVATSGAADSPAGPLRNLFLNALGAAPTPVPTPAPIALTEPVPEPTSKPTPTPTPLPTPTPTPLPPPPVPDLQP